MGWLGFGGGERSRGDSDKIDDVKVNVKTDSGGKVTDVLVASSNSNPHTDHDHYYHVDKSDSAGYHEKGSGSK
jgi:hypothetical protein